MARVRNISGEARSVPELGLGGGRLVDDGEVVAVPDDRYAGFVAQAGIWEAVTSPSGEVTDPSIDPAPADDDLGPIEFGPDFGPIDLGGDQPPSTAAPAAARKRARRGNGSN